MEGRRLDFDCQRRRSGVGAVGDIKISEQKFEESFNMASKGMHNLLQSSPEQISQLAALSEALYEYHSKCAELMLNMNQRLQAQ